MLDQGGLPAVMMAGTSGSRSSRLPLEFLRPLAMAFLIAAAPAAVHAETAPSPAVAQSQSPAAAVPPGSGNVAAASAGTDGAPAPSASAADSGGAPAAPAAAADTGSATAGPAGGAPVFYDTATIRARPLSSATASVTVVERQEVERSGARTIGELMRFIPGVDISTNGSRGGLTTAQLRGGDEKSMVLVDGVPVNDDTYQVGSVFDLEGLPADAVERIEVVRGPLSSFFGSTGLAGVVNVITRQARPGPTAARLAAAGGNASLRQADGSVSGGAGPGAYLLGGGWEEESHRIARDGFRQLNLYGNLDEPVAEGARLRLSSRWSRWHGDDYPDASGGPLLGDGEPRRSEHREESLAGEVDFDGGGHPSRWNASVYRHALDRTSPAVLRQVPASTESTAFTQLRAGGAGTLLAGEHAQWSGGLDLGEERGDNRSLLQLPFGGVRGDYRMTRRQLGAYSEALLQAGALTVELGGRLDRVTSPGRRLQGGARTEADPRLGLSWRLGGGATRLHASAGRAFKLPSFFALASPRALGGNPNLRPESGVGGDAGIEHRFAAARVDLDATLFYNRFRDLIDFDFQRFLHVNRSSVVAQGAELSLAWHATQRLSAALDATWQQVEDLTTHAPLRHRPRWVGGGHLDWQAGARLRLRLDTQAVSRYLDQQIPVPGRDSVAGYQVLGLGGSWQLANAWQLRCRIDNLADRRYQVLIGFPGAGRALRLGLQYAK
jgi:vitamin B12 transporter